MSFNKLLIKLIDVWALLGGVLLLLIVLATVVNAVGFTGNTIARLWGGHVPGLSGYEDAVQMLVGVAALAMFPYAQLHNAHASVDMFMAKAPRWANRFVELLSMVLITLIALWMAYMLTQGTLQVRSDNIETTVLAWPVWIFMPAAVLSCVLWAAAAVISFSHSAENI